MIRSYFNAVAEEINKFVKSDGYGNPELEKIAENVECRKIERTKLVRNSKGNEVVSSIEVWLPPGFEKLPPESVIVFNGEDKVVINSGHVPGIVADQYLRVYLK